MGIFIFKVWNPQNVNSFEIKVKINNYDTLGYVYPLFESDFVVFLDAHSQIVNPNFIIKPSSSG